MVSVLQSVLKMGFVLAKNVGWGEVGGHIQDMPWLPWLAVEGAWSDCFLIALLPQMGVENTPLPL